MNIISVTTNIDYPVFATEPKRTTETPDHTERAVKDIKQPAPTNHPTRKTDPSRKAFGEEEE